MTTRALPWWIENLRQRERSLGGWLTLCTAIDAANPELLEGRRHVIDRTTLQRLCEGKDPMLSQWQLQAIDCYLRKCNLEGLTDRPLFKRHYSPLSMFAPGSHIALVVGSRYLEEARTDVISKHDARAVGQFYEHPIARDCAIRPHDIGKLMPIERHLDQSLAEFERVRERASTDNIVSLGSPMSNHASERLLCTLTGAKPFQRNARLKLPVRFVFPLDPRYRSAFFVDPAELPQLDPAVDSSEFKPASHRAIIIGEDIYLSQDAVVQGGDVYSVLVMGRAPHDAGIYACVMGTSGPGTLGLAKLVASDELECPRLPLRRATGNKRTLLIAVARTRVKVEVDYLGGKAKRDPRLVGDSKLVMPPALYARESRKGWVRVDA